MVTTSFATLPDGLQMMALFDQAFAQCINYTQAPRTGTYVLLNTDVGSTILLGGNSFYTFTVNAPNTYPNANFFCFVVNSDAGRGKTISISGITSFILWPLQAFILIKNNSGAWEIIPRTQRWEAVGNITLNVDPILGNDTNDGLATGTGAIKTPAVAATHMNFDIDLRSNTGTILLADGTYSGSAAQLSLFGQVVGNTTFTMAGASGHAASVLWQVPAGQVGIFVKDYCGLELDNMTISAGSGSICLSISQFGIVDIGGGVVFGNAPGGIHIEVTDNGSANAIGSYTISGTSYGEHLLIEEGGQFNWGGRAINVSAAATFTYFALGINGGTIDAGGATFVGTGAGGASTGQRFLMQTGAILQTNGVDPNSIFPGNVAGQAQLGIADGLLSSFTIVAFSGLPTSPIRGMVVVITDSTTNTWGATIAGSGGDTVLAWYNGSNWTVVGK